MCISGWKSCRHLVRISLIRDSLSCDGFVLEVAQRRRSLANATNSLYARVDVVMLGADLERHVTVVVVLVSSSGAHRVSSWTNCCNMYGKSSPIFHK